MPRRTRSAGGADPPPASRSRSTPASPEGRGRVALRAGAPTDTPIDLRAWARLYVAAIADAEVTRRVAAAPAPDPPA